MALHTRRWTRWSFVLAPALILLACDDPTEPGGAAGGDLAVSVLVDGEGVGAIEVGIIGPDSAVAITDSAGTVAFSPVAAGQYTVALIDPPTEIEFASATRSVVVPEGGSGDAAFTGSWRLGAIAGAVRVDGVPVAGQSMELLGPVSRTEVTNATGRYEFSELPPGDYRVGILGGGGWPQSYPTNAVDTTVVAGPPVSVDFFGTELPPATIMGRVFRDQNGDLEFDQGEPGIAEPDVRWVRGSGSGSASTDGSRFNLSGAPGTYTLWINSVSHPLADPLPELAVDPTFQGHLRVHAEAGRSTEADLPVVQGLQGWVSETTGGTLEMKSRVSFHAPFHTFAEKRLVTLIESSVVIDLKTLPTVEVHAEAVSLAEPVTLTIPAPAGVAFPANSVAWIWDESSAAYVTVPTTVAEDGTEAQVTLTGFGAYLLPFRADPAFWSDMEEWFND